MGNSNLRRCSHAEKGIWIDVLCLMHDATNYGVLNWPLKEIAAAVGCKISELKSIISKGVIKGCDSGECKPYIYTPRSGRRDGNPVILITAQNGPIWYSSRMVKDEYVRTIRGESTRFCVGGGETPKDAPKPSPMPPFGDGSSSSSSSNKERGTPPSPLVQPKKKTRTSSEVTFNAWYDQIKANGEKAITEYQPVWEYAENVGLPNDWVNLAWITFKERYSTEAQYIDKKQKDWRQTFLNAVKGNWFKLWFINDEQCTLTTQGHQAKLATRETA